MAAGVLVSSIQVIQLGVVFVIPALLSSITFTYFFIAAFSLYKKLKDDRKKQSVIELHNNENTIMMRLWRMFHVVECVQIFISNGKILILNINIINLSSYIPSPFVNTFYFFFLHFGQNQRPFGLDERPTHEKWNHSMVQSLLSHPIISPYDTWWQRQ